MTRKVLSIAVAAAISGFAANQACARDHGWGHGWNHDWNDRGGSVEFQEVPVPETDAEKRQVTASPSAQVDGRSVPLAYNTLLRSGDRVGYGTYGEIVDINGNPLLAEDGSPRISNYTDFSSLLTNRWGGVFMVSHFEDTPAAMYLTELDQNPSTGQLSPLRTRPLDFSAVNGGYTHCAGSVTPWGTHLGSEEYEPNAGDPNILDDQYFAPMHEYFVDGTRANPYDYGYGTEVEVKNFYDATVTKHYAMGRFAWELGYVMPDERTVYASDDGTDVGLFRFVADEPEDLSAGYLYAAKWRQTSGEGAGAADIEWVNLGHATDAEIREFLDDKGTFDDLFERDVEGCTNIRTTTGDECLKVREGMETIASRVESRRYAAIKGASTEFRKMEGITYNPDDHVMYLSMSEIGKGMSDARNDIQVEENPCGAVYRLELDGSFAATRMTGLVAGTPVDGDPRNTCALDGIANPDNITFIPGYNKLIIGEDTGSGHQNDAVWAYNLPDGTLTRIETTPYGAESTSVYFYPNINGYAYLMSVVQHPYGESDQDELTNPADGRAYTGYIGPFPAMERQEHEPDTERDRRWWWH